MAKSKGLFWFKCYPDKFLSDFELQAMTAEERGVCFWLWMSLYCNNGKLEYNIEKLARICNTNSELVKQIVSRKFKVQRGFVVSVKVNKVMKDAQGRIDKAVMSANVRWGKPCVSNALASNSHMQVDKSRVDKNKKKSRGFTPPVTKTERFAFLQEVSEYAKSIDFDLDSQHWIDFYTSKGWMIGKNKMKDWKACVRTWKSKDGKSTSKPEKLKLCFHCKKLATIQIKTNVYICEDCRQLLKESPEYSSKKNYGLGQLEIMIGNQKAKRKS